MKYVPDLIPEHSKLPKGNEHHPLEFAAKRPTWWIIISYIGAVFFLIGTLATLFTRFWEGLCFLLIGLSLLPKLHDWIEKKLRFKFTWLIKAAFIFILFIFTKVLSVGYEKRDVEIIKQGKIEQESLAEQKRIETQKKEEEESLRRLKAEQKEQSRIDSLNFNIQKAEKEFKRNKIATAILFLNSALTFAVDEKNDIIQKRASYYYKAEKYEESINDYSYLVSSKINESENLYNRALSYNKSGEKQEAVNDLKSAIALGNKEAEKFLDKINPVKRKIAYYVTRCCDGTTSSAKGRGACSRHRGVCNWNEPVYQEYREY